MGFFQVLNPSSLVIFHINASNMLQLNDSDIFFRVTNVFL